MALNAIKFDNFADILTIATILSTYSTDDIYRQLIVDIEGNTYFLSDIIAIPATEAKKLSIQFWYRNEKTHILTKLSLFKLQQELKDPTILINVSKLLTINRTLIDALKPIIEDQNSTCIIIPENVFGLEYLCMPVITYEGFTYSKYSIKIQVLNKQQDPYSNSYLMNDRISPNIVFQSLLDLVYQNKIKVTDKKADPSKEIHDSIIAEKEYLVKFKQQIAEVIQKNNPLLTKFKKTIRDPNIVTFQVFTSYLKNQIEHDAKMDKIKIGISFCGMIVGGGLLLSILQFMGIVAVIIGPFAILTFGAGLIGFAVCVAGDLQLKNY